MKLLKITKVFFRLKWQETIGQKGFLINFLPILIVGGCALGSTLAVTAVGIACYRLGLCSKENFVSAGGVVLLAVIILILIVMHIPQFFRWIRSNWRQATDIVNKEIK